MYLINKGGILVDNYKNTKDSVLLDKFLSDDGVMIDVRMTHDGILILSEDERIYKKYYISKSDYRLLKNIMLSKIHHLYIPTLEEVLKKYSKDVLVIKLHHNYDLNKDLVLNLKNVLESSNIPQIIIIADNENLYDYLKMYTDFEVYLEDDPNIIFLDSYSNNDIFNLINDNMKNNLYLITNNPNFIKKNYIK